MLLREGLSSEAACGAQGSKRPSIAGGVLGSCFWHGEVNEDLKTCVLRICSIDLDFSRLLGVSFRHGLS